MTLNKSIVKILLPAVALLSLQSCTKNFEKINKNPYQVDNKEMERGRYSIIASMKDLQNMVIPANKEHLHQFHEVLAGCSFAGYTAVTPPWTTKFSTYNPPVDWYRAPFNDVISGIYPAYEQLHAATDDPVILAWAKLLRVASMHRITDTYGPIPYSKMSAAGGSDGSSGTALSAPYDSQEEVYGHMFEELDEVISILTERANDDPALYRKFDQVFSGSLRNWIKFANSLKLRMAMRICYVDAAKAKQKAEEAVAHSVGVMTSNADNAFLSVAFNPFELQVVQWGDDRAGADIVSFMNGYADPRRAKYFTTSLINGYAGTFQGLRSGIDVADKSIAMQYSMPIVGITDPIMWMNAAEVSFLRAEGALRGWSMGGSASTFYNQGVTLSFEQYKVSGVSDYLNDTQKTPASYVDPLGTYTYSGSTSKITIKYDDGASFEANLERIITQKWIANFPLGNESWAEFRRTGYPKIMPVVLNKSGGSIPAGQFVKRLPYPDTEYYENTDNLYNAIGMLGGPDTQGTKLWWDKKN